MDPMNSTEDYDNCHGIGESDNTHNQSRPLDRPDDDSAVGSELVSDNPNLPSRGEKFSECSLGSMPREDSGVTSPGGGGPVFFFFYMERVVGILPRLAEGRTYHPFNQYLHIRVLRVL